MSFDATHDIPGAITVSESLAVDAAGITPSAAVSGGAAPAAHRATLAVQLKLSSGAPLEVALLRDSGLPMPIDAEQLLMRITEESSVTVEDDDELLGERNAFEPIYETPPVATSAAGKRSNLPAGASDAEARAFIEDRRLVNRTDVQLSDAQHEALTAVLLKHRKVLTVVDVNEPALGGEPVDLGIRAEEMPSRIVKPRPVPPALRPKVEEAIANMLASNQYTLVEGADLHHLRVTSNVVVAAKPDGGIRMCGDSRYANDHTTPKRYPMQALGTCQWRRGASGCWAWWTLRLRTSS
jgi:hypothetical protein